MLYITRLQRYLLSVEVPGFDGKISMKRKEYLNEKARLIQ